MRIPCDTSLQRSELYPVHRDIRQEQDAGHEAVAEAKAEVI